MTKDNDSNFQWKNSGFESSERMSLRVNVKKAIAEENRNTKSVRHSFRNKPENLPNGINKIRKKIKEVFDDEDDDLENEYQMSPINPLDMENSLLNSLSEQEKLSLQKANNLEQAKILQDTAKLDALEKVNKFAKDTGLNSLTHKDIVKEIAAAPINDKELAIKIIRKELMKTTGIKISNDTNEKELRHLSRGVKKIKKISCDGKDLKELDVKDIIRAGEENLDDKKVAEMLLEKTGRNNEDKNKKAEKLRLTREDRSYINKKINEEKSREK